MTREQIDAMWTEIASKVNMSVRNEAATAGLGTHLRPISKMPTLEGEILKGQDADSMWDDVLRRVNGS